MSDKELVARFFKEGYQNRNYDFILECLSENYIDHSPAGARSNQDAVNILIAVSRMFGDMQVSIGIGFEDKKGRKPPPKCKRKLLPEQRFERAEKKCLRVLSDYL